MSLFKRKILPSVVFVIAQIPLLNAYGAVEFAGKWWITHDTVTYYYPKKRYENADDIPSQIQDLVKESGYRGQYIKAFCFSDLLPCVVMGGVWYYPDSTTQAQDDNEGYRPVYHFRYGSKPTANEYATLVHKRDVIDDDLGRAEGNSAYLDSQSLAWRPDQGWKHHSFNYIVTKKIDSFTGSTMTYDEKEEPAVYKWNFVIKFGFFVDADNRKEEKGVVMSSPTELEHKKINNVIKALDSKDGWGIGISSYTGDEYIHRSRSYTPLKDEM